MDTEYMIPIIDCPLCGAKDVPMSYEGTFTKEGFPEIELWTCTNCKKVPYVEEDVPIKRWITTEELEKMGWERGSVHPKTIESEPRIEG